MTRLAYLDCIGGVAGDMLLAAMLDAGGSRDALDDAIEALDLPDVKVVAQPTQRHGIAALEIHVEGPDRGAPRNASALLETVARAAALPERVRERSLDALRSLISAEAHVHAVDADSLVLHEIDGVDTLVDVVGVFAVLEGLRVDEVVCSPIPYVRGSIETAHGTLPGPGPAVLELLRGAELVGVDAEAELVTPTGAAIVATSARGFGELPRLTLERVGYGAGRRELASRPNLVRVVIGTTEELPVADLVTIVADMDDLLPELVPDVVDACRAAGALDVWTHAVQMKKGRTGLEVTAIARPEDEERVARALLRNGTTLGVRVTRGRRYELERAVRSVEVAGHGVRVKLGILDGEIVNVAPEHDDCSAVAAALGVPVKQVWLEAMSAAERWNGTRT